LLCTSRRDLVDPIYSWSLTVNKRVTEITASLPCRAAPGLLHPPPPYSRTSVSTWR